MQGNNCNMQGNIFTQYLSSAFNKKSRVEKTAQLYYVVIPAKQNLHMLFSKVHVCLLMFGVNSASIKSYILNMK